MLVFAVAQRSDFVSNFSGSVLADAQLLQRLLQKFEFLPIKSRIKLAAENFRLYQADLQADVDFWGSPMKVLKAKVCLPYTSLKWHSSSLLPSFIFESNLLNLLDLHNLVYYTRFKNHLNYL